ncbi:zinc ribbon domain-containing protein [Streptomyces prasinus]|uniref:zinc ribbon domain-containing protein n=1 Tax=Streptomyces prasinus TaxID=67345 RepID=UPI00369C5608
MGSHTRVTPCEARLRVRCGCIGWGHEVGGAGETVAVVGAGGGAGGDPARLQPGRGPCLPGRVRVRDAGPERVAEVGVCGHQGRVRAVSAARGAGGEEGRGCVQHTRGEPEGGEAGPSVAQRTDRGIAVEQLDGIRERVRLRRDQRGTLSSWPFHQLGQHLAYKAKRAGVPFIEVDAAYTSQHCPRCGHTERANRPDRDRFSCRRCGLAGPADHVAGVNVLNRARSAWVFVTAPVPAPA